MNKRVITGLLITTIVCASLTGCNKSTNDLISEMETVETGNFNMELKMYNNDGKSNAIKIAGYSESFDNPYKSEFTVSTKRNNSEYSEITKCYLYGSDLYIGVPGVLNELNKIESLADYMRLLDYNQDYLLVNDNYMDKAFKLYQKNLVIPKSSRNRIITEAEIAGNIDEVTKAYDRLMKENEEKRKEKENEAENKEYLSFNSYVPNSFRSGMFGTIRSLKEFVDSESYDVKLSTGVYEITLDNNQTLNILKAINESANNKEFIAYVLGNIGSKGSSEYIDYITELKSEELNNLVNVYLTDMIENANENGNTTIKLSSTGMGNKKQNIYMRITTNGVNGIEFLFNNSTKLKDKVVNVPSNCLTIEDAYNKSVEIFGNEE